MTYDLDAFDDGLFEEARALMKKRFPDMIEGYLEDANMYVDKIREGFDQGLVEQVAQYAHPLKSSSAGLGIMSVSLIAKDLELGAKDALENGTDITELKALVEPLEQSLARATSKLQNVLSNPVS